MSTIPPQRTQSARPGRRRSRLIAASLGVLMTVGGVGLVGAASASLDATCGPTPIDPIAAYNSWNVVAFGDVTISSEAEGSLAVGGSLSFTGTEPVGVATYSRDVAHLTRAELAAGDASAVTTDEDGDGLIDETAPVGLLAGRIGTSASTGVLDVQTGDVVLGSGSLPADGAVQLSEWARAHTRPDLFDALFSKDIAVETATRVAEEAQTGHRASVRKGDGEGAVVIDVTLGTTNYWNVSAAELSAINHITFDDPVMAGDTSLIVNVTDAEPVTFGVSFAGARDAEAIVWNMAQVPHIHQEGDSVEGSILAPNAKLEVLRAGVLGSVVVDSADIAGDLMEFWPFTPAPAPPLCPVDKEAVLAAAASGDIQSSAIQTDPPVPTGSMLMRSEIRGMDHDLWGEDAQVTARATWTIDGESETRDYDLPVDGTPIYGPQGLPVGTVVAFELLLDSLPATPEGHGYVGSEFLVDSSHTLDSQATVRQGDLPMVTAVATYSPDDFRAATNQKKGGITLSRGLVGVSTLAFDPDTQAEAEVVATWTDRNGNEKSATYSVPVDGTPVPGPTDIAAGTKVRFAETEGKAPVPNGYTWTGSSVFPQEVTVLEGGDPDIAVTMMNSYVRNDLGSITLRKETDGLVNAAIPSSEMYTVQASWIDSLGMSHTGQYFVPANGTSVAGPQNLEPGTVVTLSEPADTVPVPVGYTFKGGTLVEDGKPTADQGLTIQAGVTRKITIRDTYFLGVEDPEGSGAPAQQSQLTQFSAGAEEASDLETKGIVLRTELSGAEPSDFDADARTSVNVSWLERGGAAVAQTIRVPMDGTPVQGPRHIPAGADVSVAQVGHVVPDSLQLEDVVVGKPEASPSVAEDESLVTITNVFGPIDDERIAKRSDQTATGAVTMQMANTTSLLKTPSGVAGVSASAAGLLLFVFAVVPTRRATPQPGRGLKPGPEADDLWFG